MNTIDLCPVGALTSKDFRFKARVWEMSSTDGVCVGCARGCNMKMWVRNNEILRLTPRMNQEVNDYWMCDKGRLTTFASVNAGNRISRPMVRKDDLLVETSWDEAISAVASRLKTFKKNEIAAIGSPFATNEDNYLLVKFMSQLGVRSIDILRHESPGDEDDLLIRADKAPNALGARLVGIHPDGETDLSSIVKNIRSGAVKVLYVIDDDVASVPEIAEVLPKLDYLIVHASNENLTTMLADVVLSSSTYAEKHGTFTNFQGRVQRVRPSVATEEQDRALDGFSMSRLDKFGAPNDRWTKGARRDARPTWRVLAGVANALGAKWKYASAEDVFNELAASLDPFRGMSYLRIGSRGMMAKKGIEAKVAVKR
jgi:NADH-quinone oxidoreductase subunit G